MLVDTIKGPIEHDQLAVYERVWFEGGARNSNVRWFFQGELVREDGWACTLRHPPIGAEQAKIG